MTTYAVLFYGESISGFVWAAGPCHDLARIEQAEQGAADHMILPGARPVEALGRNRDGRYQDQARCPQTMIKGGAREMHLRSIRKADAQFPQTILIDTLCFCRPGLEHHLLTQSLAMKQVALHRSRAFPMSVMMQFKIFAMERKPVENPQINHLSLLVRVGRHWPLVGRRLVPLGVPDP